MECHIWPLPACSLTVWGGGFIKGTVSSPHLSVWEKAVHQLLPWCQTLQFFPICHWCLSICYPRAGVQREWVWVSPCVGSLRGTAWDSRSLFHWLSPCWFLQPEVMGIYLLGTRALGLGAWCAAGTPHSWDIHPEFLSTTHGCGTSLFCFSTHPISQDGCVFFNSVVVCLPFHSICDGSEWWLFYILVIILMWLCKETSHVYLCLHLDQNSTISYTCNCVTCK